MPHIVEGRSSAAGFRFALVVSKYHDFVTDRLQTAAYRVLEAAGVSDDQITIVRVPGAFELPIAARTVARTARFDAIICLGCLIRGATPHFDFIASAVSHALADLASESGIPIAFGVLTTNSIEEALARSDDGPSNKGWEAAAAAVEMVGVIAELAPPSSDPRGVEPS
jgi:6,7-dimethyl-8-ribityllumazine synthase